MSCNDFVKKYELANLLALFCFDCRHRAVLYKQEQSKHLGYEPADLTVHPPPQNCRGWVHFFRIGV